MEVSELQTLSPFPQIHLPHHVLFSEILVKLPIKSLIRFKAVSKEWNFIISSPEFAKFHLHSQRSCPNYSPKLLFLLVEPYSRDTSVSRRDNSFWIFDYAAYGKGGNHLYEIDSFDGRAGIWGCSDGLVLLASVSFHVWNPATRESRMIVPPTFSNHSKWGMVAGFGYVSSIDDYKIVSFSVRSESPTDDNYNYKPQAFTLCLKAGTWKRVGSYVPDFRWGSDSRAGVLVDEKTYWLLWNPSSFDKMCIVGFDLANEEFVELEPPPEWIDNPGKGYLSMIEGCLCFCSFSRCSGKVDISMLKEQGGSTSWVKFYSFYGAIFDRPFHCLNVSGLWSGKFIICSSTKCSVLIDMNQDPPITEILMTNRRHFGCVDHVEYYYVESLVSPFGVVDGNTKDDGIVADLMESSKKVRKIKPWVLLAHAIILVISIIAFAIRQVN